MRNEICKNCKYFQPIPFAMIDLCECEESENYLVERKPKDSACEMYEEKGRKNEYQGTDKTGYRASQRR